MIDLDLGRAVLGLARSAILEQLGLGKLAASSHTSLEQPAATFVTLRQSGQLRGCVGSLHRLRTLRDDVRTNAVAAAFRDPRFGPLDVAELPHTALEVSLLSVDERIEVETEEELISRLRPGLDGLTLEHGRHRATLLPQVWQQLPRARDFLAALKMKAGLAEDFWSARLIVSRYSVVTWKEHVPPPAPAAAGAL